MKRASFLMLLLIVCIVTGCGNYGRIPSNEASQVTESVERTPQPEEQPTNELEVQSTLQPTEDPEVQSTPQPTEEPSVQFTPQPTEEPSVQVTPQPAEKPSPNPTLQPTLQPETVEKEESAIDKALAKCEENELILEGKLKEAKTQLEMNQLSIELYELWDNELNSIWKQLMEKMSAEEKKVLRAEEKAWIEEKEEEIEMLTEKNAGASILPMITSQKAAELTKARVYVLAEYLHKYE